MSKVLTNSKTPIKITESFSPESIDEIVIIVDDDERKIPNLPEHPISATIGVKENQITISGDFNDLVVFDKNELIGINVVSKNNTITIILKQQSITINVKNINSWNEVIGKLIEIMCKNKRIPLYKRFKEWISPLLSL